LLKTRLGRLRVNTRSKMTFAHIICMECSFEYIQELDPWGNYYPINTYMCGHCSSRKLHKKELKDDEAYDMIDTHHIRQSYT